MHNERVISDAPPLIDSHIFQLVFVSSSARMVECGSPCVACRYQSLAVQTSRLMQVRKLHDLRQIRHTFPRTTLGAVLDGRRHNH